jgi:hypothetical protein
MGEVQSSPSEPAMCAMPGGGVAFGCRDPHFMLFEHTNVFLACSSNSGVAVEEMRFWTHTDMTSGQGGYQFGLTFSQALDLFKQHVEGDGWVPLTRDEVMQLVRAMQTQTHKMVRATEAAASRTHVPYINSQIDTGDNQPRALAD